MGKIYEAMERAQRERLTGEKHSSLPDPESPLLPAPETEMYQEMVLLYQHINSLLGNSPKKVIQFIASREGEGTSTIVREFAKAAAMILGKSVFLFDADLQKSLPGPAGVGPAGERGGRGSTAGAQPERVEGKGSGMEHDGGEETTPETVTAGWAEGNAEVATRGGAPGTAVCLIPQNSLCIRKQFYSSQIDGFWENLRQKFDLVLIDSPPFSASPDGIAISSQVDGVVLVLEAEKTRWPVAENLKNQILMNGGRILGIVFNKRRFYIPDFLYRRL